MRSSALSICLSSLDEASQGNEAQAVVEFAPFQKIPAPAEKVKKDHRIGTIEEGRANRALLVDVDSDIAVYRRRVPSFPQDPRRIDRETHG